MPCFTCQNIFLSKIHGLCWSLTDLASTHLLSDWRTLWRSRCPLVCRRAGYLSSWSPISGSQTRTTSAGRPSASGRRCKQTSETWPFYDMSWDCSLYHSHGGAAALSDQSMSHHQWRYTGGSPLRRLDRYWRLRQGSHCIPIKAGNNLYWRFLL